MIIKAQRARFWRMLLRLAPVLLAVCLILPSAASATQRALLISSYHPGFPTFFQQTAGLRALLDPAGVALDVEFLDTKRFDPQEQFRLLDSVLRRKFADLPPYDLVFAADDNALHFVLERMEGLFAGLPVVFFGINDTELATRLGADPRITGVMESPSLKANLELIHILLPGVTRVHALSDATPSGRADMASLRRVETTIPGIQVVEHSLADMRWEELGQWLGSLGERDALLLISAYRDKDQDVRSFDDSLTFLLGHTAVPVFHPWTHGLGKGIVGGKMVDQENQGRLAAALALRVLHSGSSEDVPMVRADDANQYHFDHAALLRHGIALTRLPADAVIINQPHTMLGRYEHLLPPALVLLALQAALILHLLRSRRKLRQARATTKEREEHFRAIMDSMTAGVLLIDAHTREIVDVNAYAAQAIGLPKEHIVGRSCHGFICPKPEGECPCQDGEVLLVDEDQFLLTADGKRMPVFKTVNPLHFGGRDLLLESFIDVTERKQAEDALRHTEDRFRYLVESMNDGLCLLDGNSRIVYANPSFCTMLDRGLEEIEGTPFTNFLTQESRAFFLSRAAERKAGDTTCELAFTLPDGATVSTQASGHGFQANGNDPSESFLVLTDISERKAMEQALRAHRDELELRVTTRTEDLTRLNEKLLSVLDRQERTEEALRESEATLQALVNSTDDVILLLDRDRRLIMANDAASRRHQVREGKSFRPGMTVELPNLPHSVDSWETLCNRVLSGAHVDFEYSPDPRVGHFYVGMQPVIKDEKAVGISLFARDITELHRLTRELEATAERLALATRAGGIGVWEWNLQTDELVWDDRMLEIFALKGVDPGDHVEQWLERIHPEDRPENQVALEEALEHTGDYANEFRIILPDGSVRHLKADGLVRYDQDGKPLQIIGTNRDITVRKEAEEELRRYERIVSTTPDLVSMVDRDYVFRMVNDTAAISLAATREEILGRSVADCLGREFFERVSKPHLDRAFQGEVVEHETWAELPGMGKAFLSVFYHPLREEHGDIAYVVVDAHDVTSLKMAEGDRQRVFDASLDMLCVAGFDGRFKELNPAWSRTLGWSEEELKSRPWIDFVHPDDVEATIATGQDLTTRGGSVTGFENRYFCKDGSVKWIAWNTQADTERKELFCVARDVTERKAMEDELQRLATTDPLTGADNRRQFMARAAEELERSWRYGHAPAFLALDIDHFKEVNDTYGHDAGDQVLQAMVAVCQATLRASDVFGRMGGEEFAAILVQSDEQTAMQTADRLRRILEELPVDHGDETIHFTVSIGVALPGPEEKDLEMVLKRADRALYAAKDNGRNRVELG